MRKKAFIISQALMLVGALALILAGCGTSTPSSNLAANQKFSFPLIGAEDAKTLDPALIQDSGSITVGYLVSGGLVSLDGGLNVVPDLASSWKVSPDGLTYTFTIRSGLKFSNGDPLTAQDFAYSLDRTLDPVANQGSYTGPFYLGLIVGAADRSAGKVNTIIGSGKGLEVVNDTTLIIRITQSALWFLEALTYPTAWPVDKKVVDQYGANWWDGHYVGTGPFILKSWEHKVKLVFTPNPNWWGKKPTLTEIDMPVIADATTAFNDYQGKQYDFSYVPAASYSLAKGLTKEFHEVGQLSIFYVAPNSKVPPFDNVTVRQAFAEAVDRNTIANDVLNHSRAPSCHIVPEGMPGYNKNLKCLDFNPQDAKAKLLSVYPDPTKMPKVTLEYTKSVTNDKVFTKMQQDFKTYLGVDVALNPVDFNKLTSDVLVKNAQGYYSLQFYQLGWGADYPDPEDWLDLVQTGNPNNTMNFSNSQADQLITEADSSLDQNKRIADYNQAEQIAINEVAWIPYVQGKSVYVLRPYVSGFQLSAQDQISDVSWSDVKILAH